MPSALCCIILGDRIHAFTLFYYMVHKTFSSGENHCGYQIPWSPFRVLPLLSEVSYHDDHHSINIGNYAGTCYIWDVLFNTTGPTYDFVKGDKKAK
jgi:sterol desaturase/sphingolipid hydroxylase (fatty acid hydroxylase superfamily)